MENDTFSTTSRLLFDALEHGFTSVEADAWVVDGKLSEYPGWDGTVQLLIDIKSEGEATYAAVEKALAAHPSMMARYSNGKVKNGPVEAVMSGNRPRATMAAMDKRFGFYDGRSTDLASGPAPSLMPLVSENWTKLFTWRGVGPMPEVERQRLRTYVELAHSEGYTVRFWATPDEPGAARDAMWTELFDVDVDYINTDDLAGLRSFLTARGAA